MKKLLILLAMFAGFSARAAIPFPRELDLELDKLAKKTVAVDFNYVKGDNASSTVDSGVHGLGVYLPASSIITRSFIVVKSAVTTSVGNGLNSTLAFHCEDSNNIFTATNLRNKQVGNAIEGASTGASTAFQGDIAAQCEIKATVAGDSLTGGRVLVFVEYVVAE